ncbi:MAG: hypothetical protein CTY16_08635 [Methylobacter sp.]|nr:MAG: hypothetical protein CTY16_08635 [Methylobacter sp.]
MRPIFPLLIVFIGLRYYLCLLYQYLMLKRFISGIRHCGQDKNLLQLPALDSEAALKLKCLGRAWRRQFAKAPKTASLDANLNKAAQLFWTGMPKGISKPIQEWAAGIGVTAHGAIYRKPSALHDARAALSIFLVFGATLVLP